MRAYIYIRKATLLLGMGASLFLLDGISWAKEVQAKEVQRKEVIQSDEIGMVRKDNMVSRRSISLEELDQLAKEDAGFGSRLYRMLGETYQARGNSEKAIAAYQQSLAFNKEDEDLFYRIANLQAELKDFDSALKIAEELIAKRPSNPSYYQLLSSLHDRAGNKMEASKAWDRLIELNPSDVNSLQNAANYFRSHGDLDKAMVTFEKSIALNPANFALRLQKGDLLREQKKFVELEKLYEGILSEASEQWVIDDVNRRLFDLHKEQGTLEAAIQKLEAKAKGKSADKNVHLTLGSWYYNQGQWDKSIPEFEALLKLSPGSRDLMYRLIGAYQNAGKSDLAAASFEELLKLNPDDFGAADGLSREHMKMGNADGAIIVLKDFAKRRPQDTGVRSRLAETFLEKGDVDSAVREFREIVKIDAANFSWKFRIVDAFIQRKLWREANAEIRSLEPFAVDQWAKDELKRRSEQVANELKAVPPVVEAVKGKKK